MLQSVAAKKNRNVAELIRDAISEFIALEGSGWLEVPKRKLERMGVARASVKGDFVSRCGMYCLR